MLMTRSEYAKHRGVSRQAAGRAIREGRITLDENGRIDKDTADREWEANTFKNNKNNEIPSESCENKEPVLSQIPPLCESQAIKAAYDARKEKINYELLKGELVKVKEVEKQLFSKARSVRDRLLLLPHKLAPLGAIETDTRKLELLWQEEIENALQELVRGDLNT